MTKTMRILLALAAILALLCAAALAEEAAQPEGGRKFESDWAKRNGLVEVYWEDDGYRVSVDLFNQADSTGILWQYACLYDEAQDALISVSASKSAYTLNLDTLETSFEEPAYEGLDEEGETTVFTLGEDGALRWADGRENAGQDLQFTDIGRLYGVWRNDAEEIYAEMHWLGLWDEEQFCYAAFLARGEASTQLIAAYNSENRKLECYDIAALPVETAEDFFTAQDAGRPYDVVFAVQEDGSLLLEGETPVALEYDLLGPAS